MCAQPIVLPSSRSPLLRAVLRVFMVSGRCLRSSLWPIHTSEHVQVYQRIDYCQEIARTKQERNLLLPYGKCESTYVRNHVQMHSSLNDTSAEEV